MTTPNTRIEYRGREHAAIAQLAVDVAAALRRCDREYVQRVLRRFAVGGWAANTQLLRRCCNQNTPLVLSPNEIAVLVGLIGSLCPEHERWPLDRDLRGLLSAGVVSRTASAPPD